MSDETALERIAAALDRIAPPLPEPADPLAHPAYIWRGTTLIAARAFVPLPLDRLRGIDEQKATLLANLERLAAGAAAHDTLLWGARGAGKSALVKSAVGAVQASGGALGLIEIAAERLDTLPALFGQLAGVPRAFVLFLDDLGFDAAREGRALRSMLEGGAEARPDNARLIVTANRRHLIPRDIAEQGVAASSDLPGTGHGSGGGARSAPWAINPRDAVDDNLALADRFGLSLGFHVVDQPGYLAIVRAYVDAHDLPFDPGDAIGWATRRGGRSGRVAWHYVVDLAGRHGKSLRTG